MKKMIIMFGPVLIIPILTLSLMSEPFVVSWVGDQYRDSAILVSLLVFSFVFNFIKEPITHYFVSTERNALLIQYSVLMSIVYWIGVIALIGVLETRVFAIMKFLAPLVYVIACWVLVSKDFKQRGFQFLRVFDLLRTVIPTVLIVIAFSYVFKQWTMPVHLHKALFVNISLMAGVALLSLVVSIPFNKELRVEASRYLKNVNNKLIRK